MGGALAVLYGTTFNIRPPCLNFTVYTTVCGSYMLPRRLCRLDELLVAVDGCPLKLFIMHGYYSVSVHPLWLCRQPNRGARRLYYIAQLSIVLYIPGPLDLDLSPPFGLLIFPVSYALERERAWIRGYIPRFPMH